MKPAPPDGSRDPAVDDPTNVWIVHYAGRLILPWALNARVSANLVSLAGLALGAVAALAYVYWPDPRMATLGFLLCICWLIADGLDGMIARTTGTTSAAGRFLDGVCDHSVFLLLYVALSWSLGIAETWPLAVAAGAAHAVQATLYEAERLRFERRVCAIPYRPSPRSPFLLARIYDGVAGSLDRIAAPLDHVLESGADGRLADTYRRRAAPMLRLMIPLSNNMRVVLIWLACLAGDPRWFWWITIGPLSLLAVTGIVLLRSTEAKLVRARLS